MTVSTSIAGVILAGGQSRRMGQDKAGLSFGHKTLLGHAQQLLADSGCHPVLLCGGRDGALPDRFPGLGPLAGLDSALQQLLSSGVHGLLLVPVDMPLLDASMLQALVRAGSAVNRVAHYQQHPLPLYCPVTTDMAALCERLLLDDNPRQRALHVFAAQANAVVLAADNASGKLDNINTPEDWQRLLAARKDPS